MFLKLSSQIEGQLREAYAKKNEAGVLNQSLLAEKLGVDRSAINRRLTGRVNMTEETIADMVWGLEHEIEIRIFDPAESRTNHVLGPSAPAIVSTPPAPPPIPAAANTATSTASANSASSGATSAVAAPKGFVLA
ncbi:helix-turn-helix transcriptional regulator [Bradyrhizobium sp. CCGUVB1N3]|uniref:helix-turn-helix domain-containing protein n=1 Tax=Bradyrhizobium sp. CCGUVB1N3 TaxID=2949629 RepID=UPI0020B3C91C|nr:helix-turn-helix transcriptional regulator [Bradyrhizobium sp. CCGUVB1N3]MCP3475642.1 helix-turn-helix transcriptional regulator [Bradyrhizobium sp. CCGUVB1N3]